MEHQIIKYALSHNLPISFYEDCFFSKQPMFNLESLALHNKETCSRRLLLLSVLYSLRIPRGYVTWKLRRAFITFTEFLLSRNTRSDCYTKKSPLAAFLTKRELKRGIAKWLKFTRPPFAIVVRAGHLPNDKGVVHLLSEQGFKFERDLS